MSQRLEAEQWIAAPLPRVFAFFADPRNLPRIMPPSQGAKLIKLNRVPPRFPADAAPPDAGQMAGLGTEIVFKFRALPYLPIHEKWVALITGFSLNEHFSDTQKQGPFRRWQHTHSFEAKAMGGREGTLIRDVVEYEVGFGAIGTMLEKLVFQRMLRKTFEYRKKVIERIFAAER